MSALPSDEKNVVAASDVAVWGMLAILSSSATLPWRPIFEEVVGGDEMFSFVLSDYIL